MLKLINRILELNLLQGDALRWGQRDWGEFRFSPQASLDSPSPLQTTRTVVLDLGLYEQFRNALVNKNWTRGTQKLDTRDSIDAILDRTLKNDVCEVPTAKNSSAIGEYSAIG